MGMNEELIWTAAGIAILGPLLINLWRAAKFYLSAPEELHSVKAAKWEPTEAEWTTARLRRARTERYRAEHAAWDKEFNPHETDKCPVCSGRRDRTRRSATF